MSKHITYQLCQAHAYIHEKGITHRDLKPEFEPDGVSRYRGEADEILAGHDVGLGGGIALVDAASGAVPRKRRQEVDGDEDGQDENGEDDAEGEGDVKADRQEDGREREKEKGVGREVFLDFSLVAAASQKQESLNTGNVDTSAAPSAPARAPTPTPVPVSTPDPGQQLKATTSPRARHSPRTNPGVLASATRTLVAARSTLAMTSSGDFIRLLLEFRPRERMPIADALRQPWLINYIFAYRHHHVPLHPSCTRKSNTGSLLDLESAAHFM
ncbi:hypothetical protein C8R47DRAFT_1228858 [Mycena vitilis]|nr:hypothetical protein C8R47DRAFT_1228858 [Mycena vitilis]